MRFFQGRQFVCWCGDETQEAPHTWWGDRSHSQCNLCHRWTEALDVEWCHGAALYQCVPCNRKWYRLGAHFCDYEQCTRCHRHKAPLFIGPSSIVLDWRKSPLHRPTATPYAFRAANAVLVTYHSNFQLDDFLRNDKLLDVFGRHQVARLAAHWLVLHQHPEHIHKGFVSWSDEEGVVAVRYCRAQLGL